LEFNIEVAELKSSDLLLTVIVLQSTVYITEFLNLQIARQAIGFLYFTFVPGYLILRLLRTDRFGRLATFMFSLGLSVAFLMVGGLAINALGSLIGMSGPLSLIPLSVVLNSLVLAFAICVYLRDSEDHIIQVRDLGLSPSVGFFLGLPVLSIVGAMLMNTYQNNTIPLFMVALIAFLFAISFLSKRFLPSKLYPLALWTISISLLYQTSLISQYVWGTDIHNEYYVFKTTLNSMHWTPALVVPPLFGRLNSMLSITILPTIYSNLLSIDATWVFKILFPLIFSFVPIAFYQLWYKRTGANKAFAATFFLVSLNIFYTELLGVERQMIGELFFVLLLVVVLSKEMKTLEREILFAVFSFALITSHYALAEIFIMLISFVWICLFLMKQRSRNVTLPMIAFFFCVMFLWYIYTSGSATFDNLVSYAGYVFSQLSQFLNPASRGSMVLLGVGAGAASTIWNVFGRVVSYITEIFIVLGFIGLAAPRLAKRKDFYLDVTAFLLVSFTISLLGALIIVPGLANTLGITRFYQTLLLILAPLCILGGEFLIKLVARSLALIKIVLKRRKEFIVSILLLLVLVPYFLFQTGFVYTLANIQNTSVSLDEYQMDPMTLIVSWAVLNSYKVSAASWLNKYVDVSKVNVYSDGSAFELCSYGMMPLTNAVFKDGVFGLTNTTTTPPTGIVYLSYFNVIDGEIIGESYVFNTTGLSYIKYMDKIYDNGGGESYFSP
jgi:uncharacterized membrane protein